MKIVLLSILFSSVLNAQVQTDKELKAVEAVVHQFMAGLNQKDTTILRSVLLLSCDIETVQSDGSVKIMPVPAFCQMLAANSEYDLEEKISNLQVNFDGALATAWMNYQFFTDGELSHCGSNLFTLIKKSDGWKVYNIIDTRRKNCD